MALRHRKVNGSNNHEDGQTAPQRANDPVPQTHKLFAK